MFFVCNFFSTIVVGHFLAHDDESLNLLANAIGFAGPMRSLSTFNSIHNNQNIERDNGTNSLITHFYYLVTVYEEHGILLLKHK